MDATLFPPIGDFCAAPNLTKGCRGLSDGRGYTAERVKQTPVPAMPCDRGTRAAAFEPIRVSAVRRLPDDLENCRSARRAPAGRRPAARHPLNVPLFTAASFFQFETIELREASAAPHGPLGGACRRSPASTSLRNLQSLCPKRRHGIHGRRAPCRAETGKRPRKAKGARNYCECERIGGGGRV
jgi:hypothetical protein